MVASLGMEAVSISADVLTAAVRDYDAAVDMPFVYNSWMNSYRDFARHAFPNEPAYSVYRRTRARLDALIKRGAELKIACDPDNTTIILGYACAELPVLHYVYVKEAYRRQGIALTLLNACGLSSANIIPCSHWTSFAEQIAAKRPSLLRRVDLF